MVSCNIVGVGPTPSSFASSSSSSSASAVSATAAVAAVDSASAATVEERGRVEEVKEEKASS